MCRVHRCALGWLSNEEEAHEVAQEALAKAWAARDRYDEKRPFYPWLATIVRNTCRDARSRKRPLVGLDTERVTSASPSPLTALKAAESQAMIQSALEQLDESHREVIVLRHFEDLSYAEMAEMLGVAQGTVMSRLFRARRALLELMEKGE